jgi:hypothetical protein
MRPHRQRWPDPEGARPVATNQKSHLESTAVREAREASQRSASLAKLLRDPRSRTDSRMWAPLTRLATEAALHGARAFEYLEAVA